MVFFFFSEHGKKDGDKAYLVSYDARAELLASTAVSLGDVLSLLNRSEGQRIVLLDCCYSGAGGGELLASKGSGRSGIDEALRARLSERKGTYVLSSSQPYEESYEDVDSGVGHFTKHLVRPRGFDRSDVARPCPSRCSRASMQEGTPASRHARRLKRLR